MNGVSHRIASISASLLLAVPLSLFLLFVWRADTVMDKTGLGDFTAWENYQRDAGVAFWSAIAAWLLLVVAGAFKPRFRATVIVVCSVGPILGAIAYVWLLTA